MASRQASGTWPVHRSSWRSTCFGKWSIPTGMILSHFSTFCCGSAHTKHGKASSNAAWETSLKEIFWGTDMKTMPPTLQTQSKEICIWMTSRITWRNFPPAFNYVKSQCREIQTILFSLIKAEKLDLRVSTHSNTLYKPIIKAFRDVIADLNADF